MKRETKKVKKATKRVRKPKDVPVMEGLTWTFEVPIAPPEQPKIDVKFPEVWNEEVARAAKVLGVDPLEVITKLMAFLPEHYPNHLRILEAVVRQEKAGIEEKCRPYQEAETAAYQAGRKLADEEQRRIVNLEEKIRERREIIEPSAFKYSGALASLAGSFVGVCKD